MQKLFSLFVFLFAVVGMGLLIGASTLPGPWYAELQKPPLNPPNWLFGPVWTVLYVFIAIAGWRVWLASGLSALFSVWVLQLALNFAWSPVVFVVNDLTLGMVILTAMFASIIIFIRMAAARDRISSGLFVPYAVWVAFAGYLNAGLVYLN
ncbi:TspO/MBR related protein [Roseibium hamelinense]|uniref:TspO/MBR related protein n=1 Tax=Roseibium hamelinense TaxID=150831 RepID=A0A562SLF9_9HYPH|nr:TspO/MBR family protein [Roseibium hamelinense]MTI43306.1 tryptophan-rich sensory protein [Roseibium hamelinense]TWI81764.1 TspO/MBR related protein [Roseibium hamelinense]